MKKNTAMCSLFCNPGRSTCNFIFISPKIQFLRTQASLVSTPLMLLVHNRYWDKQGEVSRDPLRHFSALKKCKNNFDCFVHETLWMCRRTKFAKNDFCLTLFWWCNSFLDLYQLTLIVYIPHFSLYYFRKTLKRRFSVLVMHKKIRQVLIIKL